MADFGLAEDIYNSGYFRQDKFGVSVKLPFKWMAVESLQEGVFSEKSDVVCKLHAPIPQNYIHTSCHGEHIIFISLCTAY